jgi:hypothetical protein
LEVSSGRVFVSRDVIFDEQVFSFMELHSNAGAHLRTEISLLSSYLVTSSNIEPKEYDTTDPSLLMSQNPVTNAVNFGDNYESVQEIKENCHGANHEEDLVPTQQNTEAGNSGESALGTSPVANL